MNRLAASCHLEADVDLFISELVNVVGSPIIRVSTSIRLGVFHKTSLHTGNPNVDVDDTSPMSN